MPRHPATPPACPLLAAFSSPPGLRPPRPRSTSMAPARGPERGKAVDLVINGTKPDAAGPPRPAVQGHAGTPILDPKAKPNPGPGAHPPHHRCVGRARHLLGPALAHRPTAVSAAALLPHRHLPRRQRGSRTTAASRRRKEGHGAGRDRRPVRRRRRGLLPLRREEGASALVIETLSRPASARASLPQAPASTGRPASASSRPNDSQALHGDGRLFFHRPRGRRITSSRSPTRATAAANPAATTASASPTMTWPEEVFPLGRPAPATRSNSCCAGGQTSGREVRLQRGFARPSRPGAPAPHADDGSTLGDALKAGGCCRRQLPSANFAEPDLSRSSTARRASPLEGGRARPLTVNGPPGAQREAVHRLRFPVKAGRAPNRPRRRSGKRSARRSTAVLRVTDPGPASRLALVDGRGTVPPPGPGASGDEVTRDPAVEVTVAGTSQRHGPRRRACATARHHGGLNFVYRLTIEPAAADFTVQQPAHRRSNVPARAARSRLHGGRSRRRRLQRPPSSSVFRPCRRGLSVPGRLCAGRERARAS